MVQIPVKPEFLRTFDDGTTDIDWRTLAPERGYVLDDGLQPIKEIVSPVAGMQFDRYGPPTGVYVSPVPETGPLDYPSRSLPYIEDPAQYHRYEIVRDFSEIEDAISELHDPVRVEALHETLELYNPSMLTRQGEIAPAFDQSGGGVQMELPLIIDDLLDLGMIREVTP